MSDQLDQVIENAKQRLAKAKEETKELQIKLAVAEQVKKNNSNEATV